MKIIRSRLGLDAAGINREAGMTLIEVMVAMVIFGMLSMGFIYTMMSVMSMSRDGRARQVAANLAAEEIDRARDVPDILDLQAWSTASAVADPNDVSRPAGAVNLNGVNFHIVRTVEWVSDPDSALPCGASASGAGLRYKRVNVRVTWDGMRGTTPPVASDTVLNPRTPVNDPTKGTILVSVLTAAGTGAAGVTVTTSPALSVAASPTDSSGCTYLLKMAPGTYSVSIAKSGFVDEMNVAVPSKTGIVIEAGKTVAASFQYDLASRYNVSYPYPFAASDSSKRMPTNLQTSFVSTLRTHVATAAASYQMHPSASGYTIVGGDAEKCLAANPANWPDATIGVTDYVAPVLPVFNATPTSPASASVALGPVTVSGIEKRTYIKAVSVSGATPVFPACSSSVTYAFDRLEDSGSAVTRTLALPYGSWKLHRGTSSTFTPSSSNQLTTGIAVAEPSSVGGGVVTIDPRIPNPAG